MPFCYVVYANALSRINVFYPPYSPHAQLLANVCNRRACGIAIVSNFGVGVEESSLWLSFAQQKLLHLT
jgi:hypothetical protein